MKKQIIILISLIFVAFTANAQKFAYVDTEYILSHIPSYQTAKDKLNEISAEWQKEIEDAYTEIDKLDRAYQSEKVLLTDEMQKKREEDIAAKIKAAKELQKKYFGKDGELFKKRQELVKPIQDEVYNAVKEIATEGSFALIFDISGGGATILYSDPKSDKSDDVLEKLGYKN